MIYRRIKLAIAALALIPALASAQTALPPLPADIKPTATAGLGLTVSDLDRSMRFYTDVLGMKVDAQYPATGAAVEYLLGYTGDRLTDTLVVVRQGQVQPGATGFGRIVLVVPDGRKLAERVKSAGMTIVKTLPSGTSVVTDPDGYLIELYQRPVTPK